jgi:hypothetical protein
MDRESELLDRIEYQSALPPQAIEFANRRADDTQIRIPTGMVRGSALP